MSTKHHKEWDKYVIGISGGLTVLKPAKGSWVHKNKLYNDRVIPVRIACSEKQIQKIAKFTVTHYRQLAVMYFQLSTKCFIVKEQSEEGNL